MQVMTVAASTELMDTERIVTILAGAVSGAGGSELVRAISGRRKINADATAALTQAMETVVKSAQNMLEPQARELAEMRTRHAEDLRDIRAQHSEAMARVMLRLGEVQGSLDQAMADVKALRRENEDLRSQLAIKQ